MSTGSWRKLGTTWSIVGTSSILFALLLVNGCSGTDETRFTCATELDAGTRFWLGTDGDHGDQLTPLSVQAREAEPVLLPVAPEPAAASRPEPQPELVISPSPELESYVRASVERFRARLELPVSIGQSGVPVTLEDQVTVKGKAVDGAASYSKLCRFQACVGRARIRLSANLLTTKRRFLENVIDHEIGHILSAWGTALKVSQHLPEEGHVMSSASGVGPWTAEDVFLWCSASPCGKESWNETDNDNGASHGNTEHWTLPDSGLPDGGLLLPLDSGADANP